MYNVIEKCICAERGLDGTFRHDEPCGRVYISPIPINKQYTITKPCKNHEGNYIRCGWSVIEPTTMGEAPQDNRYIDLSDIGRLEIERFE